MKLPLIFRLSLFVSWTGLILFSLGCGGAEKARAQLEKTLERSAVVFACKREDNRFVVTKIFKMEESWGSNIKIGDVIDGLPVRENLRGVGVLVTREYSQWAVNGQLAQGAIPFDRKGQLLLGRMTLHDVEDFYARKK